MNWPLSNRPRNKQYKVNKHLFSFSFFLVFRMPVIVLIVFAKLPNRSVFRMPNTYMIRQRMEISLWMRSLTVRVLYTQSVFRWPWPLNFKFILFFFCFNSHLEFWNFAPFYENIPFLLSFPLPFLPLFSVTFVVVRNKLTSRFNTWSSSAYARSTCWLDSHCQPFSLYLWLNELKSSQNHHFQILWLIYKCS